MPKTSLRIPDDALAEIDRRAAELGISRTAFMLRTALGRVTADEQRLVEIEERLARVEANQFGAVD